MTAEMICPACNVGRADYEGPDGAWLLECPNCGSGADPVRTDMSPETRSVLIDVATDLEWAASKQDRPEVALGFRAAAARVRERLDDQP